MVHGFCCTIFVLNNPMKKGLVIFSFLLFVLQMQAQDIIQLLSGIKAANSEITSIESEVTKTLLKSNKTITQEGKLYYVSPNEFSAQFTTGEYMIVNEKKIKIDIGIFHGTYKLREGSKIESLSNIFLYAFQGRIQDLMDENNFDMTTESEDGYYIITGTNKKKKILGIGYKKAVFKFQAESLHVEEIDLYDYKGNVDTFRMSDIKYNVPIDRKIFQF